MNRRDRLWAAARGEAVDRIPVSLWRHFPNEDHTAEELADRTIQFQERYGFDFVKLTPMGLYGVEDWGTIPQYFPGTLTPPVPKVFGVREEADWGRIHPLEVTQGRYGQEVRAVGLVRAGLGEDVPILQTVFSPITTAAKLAGEFGLKSLRSKSTRFARALEAITDTTIRFAQCCRQSGADGFFFATKCSTAETTSPEEHEHLVRPWDLPVLEALASMRAFVLVHVHGLRPHLDVLQQYRAHAVSWHDRRTSLTLGHVKALTSRCVVGGIDEIGTLLHGSRDEIVAQVLDAIRQTDGRNLIIAPGCVVPPQCDDVRYRAVLSAVLSLSRNNH